jgi:cytochrome c5
MNKKYLFSILLACVFLISPVTYAADVATPVYQVNVMATTSDETIVRPAAAVAVQPSETMQSVANITLEPADLVNKVSQCNSCHSIKAAAGIIGVSGGDSIGIGKPV